MEEHKKILGIVFIVSAILQMVMVGLLSIFFSTIFSFALSQAEPKEGEILELIISIVRFLPAVVIICFSLPSLVAGIGLINKQKWALIMALVLGCFKLLSFPIGTAIGVYTIWVYVEDGKQAKINPANG